LPAHPSNAAVPTTAAEPPTRRPGLAAWTVPGLLVLATLAAYHNTFKVPFLLDDAINIVENDTIQGASWSAVLFPPSQVYTAGRPLLNVSYALNHAVGGLSVTGYHIANLGIHLASALVLWALVRRALALRDGPAEPEEAAPRIAFFAALLWALHPIQTVCVTYLSQRAESLMGLCYLLTLYCFIRGVTTSRPLWSVLAVACCGFGMLAKEVMVTAPVMVLVFDRTFVSGSFRAAWRARAPFYLCLAATWAVALALMITSRVADRGVGYTATSHWLDYPRIESGAVLRYLGLAFWPNPLVFDYGREIPIPAAGLSLVNLLVLALLLAGIGLALYRRKVLGFLGCWFFLILAPTSSVVPVTGQPIAENRLYLSLAAPALAAAWAGSRFLRGRKGLLALTAAALALGALTVARNRVYHTAFGVWADTVAKRPGNSRAHLHYGICLLEANRLPEGTRELEHYTLQLDPANGEAHANLGYVAVQQKRFDQALSHFQAAVTRLPGNATIRSNYGNVLFRVGHWEEALPQFLEAVRLRPTLLAARLNAGILLSRLGRPAEAVTMFEETLRLYPTNPVARRELTELQTALQTGTYKPTPRPPR
jgi:Tfp pilus assembly protein PilF